MVAASISQIISVPFDAHPSDFEGMLHFVLPPLVYFYFAMF